MKKALAGRKRMRTGVKTGELDTAAVTKQLLETRSLVDISSSC